MMNNWNEYLSTLALPAQETPAAGALRDAPAAAAAAAATGRADFGAVLTPAQLADGFVAPVDNLGLTGVAGDDAATFLHGQLTNDVANLAVGEVRLAGYCTPKGRLQATMLMWREAALDGNSDQQPGANPAASPASGAGNPAEHANTASTALPASIYLLLPRAVQAPFQKRLSMFVMRAKATLRDASAQASHAVLLGLGGARAASALAAHVDRLPPAPNTVTSGAHGTLLRLADAFGAPRYLWLTSAASARAAMPALQQTLALGGTDAWELAAIHAGVAQVTPATVEQFVPQMINYELLGGVNFKKGCYPGQEIVARSQYLGKLKRRTTLARIDDPSAAAGQELFAQDDPGQPCGMVVNAAPNGAGGVDALVEVKLASLEQVVHLGSTSGAALQFLPMPYALDPLDL